MKACADARLLKTATIILLLVAVDGSARQHFGKISTASFIPAAALTATRSDPRKVFRCFQLDQQQRLPLVTQISTALASKKKAASAPASKKIQVKLLKYVEGTGQKGEIVMVTPAFFQNKLRPAKAAEIISDEEVQEAAAQAEALEKATTEQAKALKSRIEDLSLVIRRKAGPDGQLFGGVGPKVIIDALKEELQDDFLQQKGVKIIALTSADAAVKGDIKHIGEFRVRLSLTRDVAAELALVVKEEN